MADGVNILSNDQLDNYINVVLPKIEKELMSDSLGIKEKQEIYDLYVEILRLCAHDDFICFNRYLELDEDHTQDGKAFYYHRKDALAEVFTALNDMERYDKYDYLLISMPPRVGKSTSGIRFLAWICGRYPEKTQLATSYSDNITTSFYIGVNEIVSDRRFLDVFPQSPLVNRNGSREEIWLKVMRRYPTITFVSIDGSMTGRAEAGNYLYCDDLVSGIEQALSFPRMEKLWTTYTTNAKQRKLDGCKEIHIATVWSVHDVISRLSQTQKDNPRCKIIKVPCYDENGESQFNFKGGFSTKYYRTMQDELDPLSFNALYQCEAVEREGLLYHEEDLKYYTELPSERPDTIIGICDSKNLGNDYVCSLVGYVYDDIVFIEDVVFNNGLPEITRPLVANSWNDHKVVRADVEMNNGGNYYAENLQNLIKQANGHTSIRMFFSGNNKKTKIITYSDYVKKHFVFKDKSAESYSKEYANFMKNLLTWSQTGKNEHDDGPDAIAMLAQLVQELQSTSITILNRRELNI